MIFKILSIDSEKIIYSISFYQEIIEVLEYGWEFNNIIETKHIDYLFSILRSLRYLTADLREQIVYRSLILEFRENYFITVFEQTLIRDLDFYIELDNTYLEDIDHFSDLDSWYYNSD